MAYAANTRSHSQQTMLHSFLRVGCSLGTGRNRLLGTWQDSEACRVLTPMARTHLEHMDERQVNQLTRWNTHMKTQHAVFTAVGARLASYLKTKPRRVRNYAAESPASSNAKRAAFTRKLKLRHAIFETTPRNSFPVQCFP